MYFNQRTRKKHIVICIYMWVVGFLYVCLCLCIYVLICRCVCMHLYTCYMPRNTHTYIRAYMHAHTFNQFEYSTPFTIPRNHEGKYKTFPSFCLITPRNKPAYIILLVTYSQHILGRRNVEALTALPLRHLSEQSHPYNASQLGLKALLTIDEVVKVIVSVFHICFSLCGI